MKPRRVLMTCDALGGIWRYCVDLSTALEAAGIDVFLVGTGTRPSDRAATLLARPPRWLDLPPSWMAGRPGDVREIGRAIAALQREVGADLVHLNQPGEGAFLDVDVPVVVAAHSCLGTWWRSVLGGDPDGDWRWRAELEAAAFRRADIVAAPTVSHAEAVAAAYGIRLPVVVPNASVASSGPVRDRTPTVVAAARWWDAGKNLAVLDQAASACRWPVLLFGSLEGPDGTAVCARHARPLGPRPSDEVHQAMRRAALFASPSLYEPFGLAALEAARSGAALVLADIPTYREIWDGAACFFDPRAPAALANALDRLTRDGGERARLAAAAARRAATFTPNAQVAALGRVYDAAGATLQPAS